MTISINLFSTITRNRIWNPAPSTIGSEKNNSAQKAEIWSNSTCGIPGAAETKTPKASEGKYLEDHPG